jgi:hypothetical protein
MAGNTKAQTKKTLAQVLKADVRERQLKPEGLTLKSRAHKRVVQTNTDALLSAAGSAQNPVNSDLDICFVPALPQFRSFGVSN